MSANNDAMEDKREPLINESRDEPILPVSSISSPPKQQVHPAFYVTIWIALSSSVILFNKKILDKEKGLNFPFPGWALGKERPTMKTFGNVSIIGIGVIIASYGEIKFVMIGFVFQALGVAFEATRLALMEKLLNSAEYKMDPLVSLYYFAPVCAAMNFVIFLSLEASTISLDDIFRVGPIVLLLNALVAFALNVSVVFLIGKTSSLVLTLCGVLKDILLVVISVTWIHDPVKPLQVFGYSIALTGLVVYKLGADKLREHYSRFSKEGALRWNEYGTKYPAYRKAAVFGVCGFIVLLLFFTYSNGNGIDVSGSPDGVTNTQGGVSHTKRGLESIIPIF
ncbi:hypothetical protein AA313_de0202921 [Arthrobotrys entomopaga]|nr:hypothetical protein AA313_de0202921 [Arthrobotrys entomopaga]